MNVIKDIHSEFLFLYVLRSFKIIHHDIIVNPYLFALVNQLKNYIDFEH
jgi:hypothetical protein